MCLFLFFQLLFLYYNYFHQNLTLPLLLVLEVFVLYTFQIFLFFRNFFLFCFYNLLLSYNPYFHIHLTGPVLTLPLHHLSSQIFLRNLFFESFLLMLYNFLLFIFLTAISKCSLFIISETDEPVFKVFLLLIFLGNFLFSSHIFLVYMTFIL